MKIFHLPERVSMILFDMDCTLYTHPQYAQSQTDLPIERLARQRGVSFDAMSAEIAEWQSAWSAEHEGRKVSMGNTLAAFGIPIAQTIKWREELCQPEQYLSLDGQLRSALEELAARFALAVVTNNPVSIARRTLATLGVGDLFRALVGLDTCGVSKPHEEPFMRAAALCGAPARDCVSVGDRYDMDIALPLELGMGGILVDGVQDVYRLPTMLSNRLPCRFES